MRARIGYCQMRKMAVNGQEHGASEARPLSAVITDLPVLAWQVWNPYFHERAVAERADDPNLRES